MRNQDAVTVEWSDELLLGIPSFDAEHRSFIGLISQFIERVDRGDEKIFVEPLLDKIVDVFRFHAADEENLLDAHDFDGRHDHAREHRQIGSLMETLRMEFLVTQSPREHLNIARLIGTTIVDHIRYHDRQYADFLRETGIT